MNTISAGISGFSLALVAASLASLSGQANASPEAAAKVETGHCMGVNACKGHNGCKTAANACKGQGGCKGQGFVPTLVARWTRAPAWPWRNRPTR